MSRSKTLPEIRTRRVYEAAKDDDGLRVLVDRLWPRGVRKEDLKYDLWDKDVAPSPALRKWFGHAPERWEKFHARYEEELDSPRARDRLRAIIEAADGRNITLLYGARDAKHNHALILADAIKRLY